MKRILSLLMSTAALIILLFFLIPTGVYAEESPVTQEEAVRWILAAENRYWDWDQEHNAQCVDLIYYYYNYLGVSPMGGNANHYIYDNLSGCKVPAGWERIQCFNGFRAQPGDIALFDFGENGHIGLVLSADEYGMTTLENNRNYDSTSVALMGRRGYDSLNFWGVIRPNFSKKSILITYDVNGGSWPSLGNYVTQYKLRDQTITLLRSNPIKPGYKFIGWSTDPNGSTAQYQPGDTYSENLTLALYAVWTFDPDNAFTVSYHANGGSDAPEAQIKGRGYDLILTSDIPYRSGYAFVGWSKDPNAKTASYTSGGKYTADANITLYAVWEPTGFVYTVTNQKATITDYGGPLSELTIPATLDGYPVTCIGSDAFAENKNLVYVEIPNGVAMIESSAFSDCQNLKTVVIPDSVTQISEQAFLRCYNLTRIELPEGLTTIGDSAFDYCSNLTTITIPDSVTTIGSGAFCNCSNLTSIKLPSGITEISVALFENCDSLNGITIPDGVTSIGDGAFRNCYGLTNISIPGSVSRIGSDAFNSCESLISITLPEGIAIIEDGTFVGCEALFKVMIPSTVKEIGEFAFYECTNLTNITIPEGVVAIGDWAFQYCYSLRSITIPNGVKHLGWEVFSNCYSLTDVTIGNSVTSIGYYTFYGCSSLTNVVIPDSVTSIGYCAFYGCSSLTSVVLPDGVTRIDGGAFQDCSSLVGINIPNSVTEISDWAFFRCYSLRKIVIPDSVTYLGKEAFYECTALTNVYIGKNVPYIDAYTFWGCTNLKNVTISDGVTGIETYAFYNCSSLTGITIPNSVTYIGGSAFSDCSSLQYVVLPNGITCIDDFAFFKCYKLTSITIPNNVTYIGNNAFSRCTSLTSVAIPNNVTHIGEGAFAYCTSLTYVEIPDSVVSIDQFAFFDCDSLKSIIIPENVAEIGKYAFLYCDNLTGIWVSVNNNYYTNDTFGVLYTKDKRRLIQAPSSLTGIYYVPDGVTTIGEAAFSYCYDLTSIILSNTVTLIEAEAFYGCYGLLDITLGSNVSSIGNDCFGECYTSLVINYIGTEGNWNLIQGVNDLPENITVKYITNGKVVSWGMILDDSLTANFKIKFADNIIADHNAYVSVLVAGNEQKIPISQAVNGIKVEMSAAQMTDEIVLRIVSGDGSASDCYSYTIKEYAEFLLSDETYSAYHTIVKEMLNYGAMAQNYFGYNIEQLANDGLTGAAYAEIPKYVEDMSYTGTIRGLNFYGASLVYRDRIAVRYYFTGDLTGCTFTENGNIYQPVAKDGMYYVEIADILPQNLDQQITLTVFDAEGNTLSVTYGPMNYIVRMNEKGSDALKNLLKALYNYHLAAKALA